MLQGRSGFPFRCPSTLLDSSFRCSASWRGACWAAHFLANSGLFCLAKNLLTTPKPSMAAARPCVPCPRHSLRAWVISLRYCLCSSCFCLCTPSAQQNACELLCCSHGVKFVAGDSPGVLLSHRIESLENLWSKSFSHGSFPNTPTRCSVKCLRWDKLFFELILPVGFYQSWELVRFVWFYQSDFTRAENLSVLSDFTSRILPELRTCPFYLILPVGFYQGWELVCFVWFYQSDFTRAENLSGFLKSEGVSDFEVWDIGQVTVSNFDWLSFTPPFDHLLRSFIMVFLVYCQGNLQNETSGM
jgi:hypothetical protein